uniref:BZIP domain-containing protein n=1 Tax=Tetraselmis sp. GSL018 TaxID=582737 RepID=A0A061S2K3_9CHLO
MEFDCFGELEDAAPATSRGDSLLLPTCSEMQRCNSTDVWLDDNADLHPEVALDDFEDLDFREFDDLFQNTGPACLSPGQVPPSDHNTSCHGHATEQSFQDNNSTSSFQGKISASDCAVVGEGSHNSEPQQRMETVSSEKAAESSETTNSECSGQGTSCSELASQLPVGEKPSTPGQNTERSKQTARQQRNRECAAQSRFRKKQYLKELEERCQHLEAANLQLNAMVQQLSSENASLRCQLAGVFAGQLSAPPVGAFQGASQHIPLKVPMPKQPPQQQPSRSKRKAGTSSATQHTGGKHMRSAAGGTKMAAVILSVVCCVAILSSPWEVPLGSTAAWDSAEPVRKGRSLASAGTALSGLSASESATAAALKRVKRAVLMLPGPGLSNSSDVYPERKEQTSPSPDRSIEAEVMLQLRRLGPLALSRQPPDGDGGGAAPQGSFPLLARDAFVGAGLMSPVTCTQVLTFQQRPDGTSARRADSTGPRWHHSRKGFAIPLLPSEQEALRQGPGGSPGSAGKRIGDCGAADADAGAVVSVFFPASDANRSSDAYDSHVGALRSVDQLYIVVLAPQSTYTAYRCDLPQVVHLQ